MTSLVTRLTWRKLQDGCAAAGRGADNAFEVGRVHRQCKPLSFPVREDKAEAAGRKLLRLAGRYARTTVIGERERLRPQLAEAADAVDAILTEAADQARRPRADIDG